MPLASVSQLPTAQRAGLVVEYLSPVLAVSYAAPAPVVAYLAPVLAVHAVLNEGYTSAADPPWSMPWSQGRCSTQRHRLSRRPFLKSMFLKSSVNKCARTVPACGDAADPLVTYAVGPEPLEYVKNRLCEEDLRSSRNRRNLLCTRG